MVRDYSPSIAPLPVAQPIVETWRRGEYTLEVCTLPGAEVSTWAVSRGEEHVAWGEAPLPRAKLCAQAVAQVMARDWRCPSCGIQCCNAAHCRAADEAIAHAKAVTGA